MQWGPLFLRWICLGKRGVKTVSCQPLRWTRCWCVPASGRWSVWWVRVERVREVRSVFEQEKPAWPATLRSPLWVLPLPPGTHCGALWVLENWDEEAEVRKQEVSFPRPHSFISTKAQQSQMWISICYLSIHQLLCARNSGLLRQMTMNTTV